MVYLLLPHCLGKTLYREQYLVGALSLTCRWFLFQQTAQSFAQRSLLTQEDIANVTETYFGKKKVGN